jgi:hypothetical protein
VYGAYIRRMSGSSGAKIDARDWNGKPETSPRPLPSTSLGRPDCATAFRLRDCPLIFQDGHNSENRTKSHLGQRRTPCLLNKIHAPEPLHIRNAEEARRTSLARSPGNPERDKWSKNSLAPLRCFSVRRCCHRTSWLRSPLLLGRHRPTCTKSLVRLPSRIILATWKPGQIDNPHSHKAGAIVTSPTAIFGITGPEAIRPTTPSRLGRLDQPPSSRRTEPKISATRIANCSTLTASEPLDRSVSSRGGPTYDVCNGSRGAPRFNSSRRPQSPRQARRCVAGPLAVLCVGMPS